MSPLWTSPRALSLRERRWARASSHSGPLRTAGITTKPSCSRSYDALPLPDAASIQQSLCREAVTPGSRSLRGPPSGPSLLPPPTMDARHRKLDAEREATQRLEAQLGVLLRSSNHEAHEVVALRTRCTACPPRFCFISRRTAPDAARASTAASATRLLSHTPSPHPLVRIITLPQRTRQLPCHDPG